MSSCGNREQMLKDINLSHLDEKNGNRLKRKIMDDALLSKVFSFLDYMSLSRMSRVSKQFHNIYELDYLWDKFFQTDKIDLSENSFFQAPGKNFKIINEFRFTNFSWVWISNREVTVREVKNKYLKSVFVANKKYATEEAIKESFLSKEKIFGDQIEHQKYTIILNLLFFLFCICFLTGIICLLESTSISSYLSRIKIVYSSELLVCFSIIIFSIMYVEYLFIYFKQKKKTKLMREYEKPDSIFFYDGDFLKDRNDSKLIEIAFGDNTPRIIFNFFMFILFILFVVLYFCLVLHFPSVSCFYFSIPGDCCFAGVFFMNMSKFICHLIRLISNCKNEKWKPLENFFILFTAIFFSFVIELILISDLINRHKTISFLNLLYYGFPIGSVLLVASIFGVFYEFRSLILFFYSIYKGLSNTFGACVIFVVNSFSLFPLFFCFSFFIFGFFLVLKYSLVISIIPLVVVIIIFLVYVQLILICLINFGELEKLRTFFKKI